ncbi:MAG: hypothetical protein WAK93_12705 [Solirubrobacteraceae bacterium]
MNAARFAVHVHSTWSHDGFFRLDVLVRLLRTLGYRGVLMSEHDQGFDEDRWGSYQEACAQLSSESFLVVPGIEYANADGSVHVPVWGARPFLGEALDTPVLLDRVSETGGAAVMAHPSRHQAWRQFRPEWSAQLLGVEIWNVKEDGYALGADGLRLWREHDELVPFAALDLHTPRQLFPLAMEIAVTAELSRASVQAALADRAVRPLAFGYPAASFDHGRRREIARRLEQGRHFAISRVKRVVKGHY